LVKRLDVLLDDKSEKKQESSRKRKVVWKSADLAHFFYFKSPRVLPAKIERKKNVFEMALYGVLRVFLLNFLDQH
jgi:hypothetical protein